MFWALHWAVSRNLCDDFYLDINCVMKLTALLAVANLYLCHWSAYCKLANLCLWFISSANSTVLRPIAFPRSALCLRVSCKINKNYECETLSPLLHRFCCKGPRIPRNPLIKIMVVIANFWQKCGLSRVNPGQTPILKECFFRDHRTNFW